MFNPSFLPLFHQMCIHYAAQCQKCLVIDFYQYIYMGICPLNKNVGSCKVETRAQQAMTDSYVGTVFIIVISLFLTQPHIFPKPQNQQSVCPPSVKRVSSKWIPEMPRQASQSPLRKTDYDIVNWGVDIWRVVPMFSYLTVFSKLNTLTGTTGSDTVPLHVLGEIISGIFTYFLFISDYIEFERR